MGNKNSKKKSKKGEKTESAEQSQQPQQPQSQNNEQQSQKNEQQSQTTTTVSVTTIQTATETSTKVVVTTTDPSTDPPRINVQIHNALYVSTASKEIDKLNDGLPYLPGKLGQIPYSLGFALARFPLLSLTDGRASKKNSNLVNGPISRRFFKKENITSVGAVQNAIEDWQKKKISIVFLGDIMPIKAGDFPKPDSSFYKTLSDVDLVFCNVESPITGKDIDLTKMSTTLEFDMSAEYFGKVAENFLLRQGAVFSVANNHAGDQGLDGLRTTVDYLKKLGVVVGATSEGGGSDNIIATIIVKGVKIGIVAWTRWMNSPVKNKLIPVWREPEIRSHDWAKAKLENQIDILIGFPHWDFEQSFYPSKETTDLAHELVGEGKFDLIVGHGPHVLQPVELIGKGVCNYSIGNVCSERGPWQTELGSFFKVQFHGKKIYRYKVTPFYQHDNKGTTIIQPLSLMDDNILDNHGFKMHTLFRERLELLYDLLPGIKTGVPTYQVKIKTANILGAGATMLDKVGVKLVDDQNNISDLLICQQPFSNDFQRGEIGTFYVRPEKEMGNLKEIIISYNKKSTFFGDWKLDWIEILSLSDSNVYHADCDFWFKETIEKNFPLTFSDQIDTLKSVDELESQMKTGDILLYTHEGLRSAVIRTVINSQFSHASILVDSDDLDLPNPDGSKHMVTFTSCENDDETKDIINNMKYAGVHCFSLRTRILSYKGNVYYFKLKKELTHHQKRTIVDYLSGAHGSKVSFNFEGMIECGLKHLGLSKAEGGQLASVFSSELVATALRKAELLPKDCEPSSCTPKILESLSIFEPPQILKTYKG